MRFSFPFIARRLFRSLGRCVRLWSDFRVISAEKSACVQKRSAYAKPPPIDQIASGVLP